MVALATGHTSNAMQANLVRVLTLPLVWYAAVQGAGLLNVIWIATAGEVGGYLLSLWLLRKRVGVDLKPMALPITCLVLFMGAAAFLPPSLDLMGNAVLIVLFALILLSMADLRRYISGRRNKGA